MATRAVVLTVRVLSLSLSLPPSLPLSVCLSVCLPVYVAVAQHPLAIFYSDARCAQQPEGNRAHGGGGGGMHPANAKVSCSNADVFANSNPKYVAPFFSNRQHC